MFQMRYDLLPIDLVIRRDLMHCYFYESQCSDPFMGRISYFKQAYEFVESKRLIKLESS